MDGLAEEICRKIRIAAKVNIHALEYSDNVEQYKKNDSSADNKMPAVKSTLSDKIDLIVIGASTGGTIAIKMVLCELPEIMPPIVVVQHMPESFTKSFAESANKSTCLDVEEFVTDGKELSPGCVYIANGANHMEVRTMNGAIKGYVVAGPKVNRHRPAVDVLFSSVAKWSSSNVIGVLLTGMGADGARGLGELHSGGAETIAQDEESSIVWGMPRVAIEQEAASHVLPLSKISEFLVDRCYQ